MNESLNDVVTSDFNQESELDELSNPKQSIENLNSNISNIEASTSPEVQENLSLNRGDSQGEYQDDELDDSGYDEGDIAQDRNLGDKGSNPEDLNQNDLEDEDMGEGDENLDQLNAEPIEETKPEENSDEVELALESARLQGDDGDPVLLDYSNSLISPCLFFHKEKNYDHNIHFDCHLVGSKKNKCITDTDHYYHQFGFNGVSCDFDLGRDQIKSFYYNYLTDIHISVDMVDFQNYKLFIRNSWYSTKLDKFIMHKIYLGACDKLEKNTYHLLKHFNIISINTSFDNYNSDDILKFYNHSSVKDAFYKSGCLCVLLQDYNGFNELTSNDLMCLFNFLNIIISSKINYYKQSDTYISLMIGSSLSNAFFACLLKNFYPQISQLYELILSLHDSGAIKAYESKESSYQVNFDALAKLYALLNKCCHVNKSAHNNFIYYLIFLNCFIKSNIFLSMEQELQEMIMHIIQSSDFGNYITIEDEISDATKQLLSKKLKIKEKKHLKHTAFIFITHGYFDVPNISGYQLLHISKTLDRDVVGGFFQTLAS